MPGITVKTEQHRPVQSEEQLKLPISSLNEEFMVTCTREVLQYRESNDPNVSQTGIEVRTGRSWRVQEAVVESWVWHSVVVG